MLNILPIWYKSIILLTTRGKEDGWVFGRASVAGQTTDAINTTIAATSVCVAALIRVCNVKDTLRGYLNAGRGGHFYTC